MQKIAIITASYPYSLAREETFLVPELKILSSRFEIILIPMRAEGARLEQPRGVSVIDSYGRKPRWWKVYLASLAPFTICSSRFWLEIKSSPWILKNPAALIDLVKGHIVRKRLAKWMEKSNARPLLNSCQIIYTYWFGPETAAALDYASSNKRIKIITRAHGWDLYKERRGSGYIPFREESIRKIDKVFLISRHGVEYLTYHYPNYRKKFICSPLGIEDRGICRVSSDQDVFRVISCSYISLVKRLDRIAAVLAHVAGKTNKRIEWFHIGDGNERAEISSLIKATFPENAKAEFIGNISNEEVFEFYARQPLDLYIMLSQSEGRPVALMEAISVGLPVAATRVGGIPELICDGFNGLLFDLNESDQVIAEAILRIVNSPNNGLKMGHSSRLMWKSTSSARENFQQFSGWLERIACKR